MLYKDIVAFSIVDLRKTIGETIRRDMKTKRLKQKDVAEDAGITPMSLYRLCQGENASLDTYIRVLKAIGRLDVLESMTTEARPEPRSYLYKFKKKTKKNSGEDEGRKVFTKEDFDALRGEEIHWTE